MKTLRNKALFLLLTLYVILQTTSCKTSQNILPNTPEDIQSLKQGGGSSGMEILDEESYLVVYDIKSYKAGPRLAMIKVTEEAIQVRSIHISDWGEEGRASDLESICSIPGTTDEYFIAESGNWEGEIGRIFHIQVDTSTLSAKVLGITKLPFLDINNLEVEGDQYESIACLPYSEHERILILAERGGSSVNPRGIIRWGIYNLQSHQLSFSDVGMAGISVDAPGEWTDIEKKRDITDLHIDPEGGIWASASEDVSEAGPFYSIIYKIGQLDATQKDRPFIIFEDFPKYEVVSGFKIEALSGTNKNIDCTHSFGTEDEIYGGVWRPVTID